MAMTTTGNCDLFHYLRRAAFFSIEPPLSGTWRTTMAKAKFERNKPHVNVGTIGHVDHGKTT
ncbi:MAG: hypothetical protein KDJ55_07215, partial [Rhodobiaceae bacterium]|nr:hypothetical protein [Rhodobiaceae bacterium]